MLIPVEFPDAVEVVITYLRSVLPGIPILPSVPEPRPAEFIRIERLGGLRDSIVTDRPRIDIHCWSDSQAHAEELMRRTRAYAHAMPGVYRVREVAGPQWLPDSTSGQARYAFAIEFATRGRAL